MPFIVGIWLGWMFVVTFDGPIACGIWPPDWPATQTPGNRVWTVPAGQSADAGAASTNEPDVSPTAHALMSSRRFTVT